MKILIFDNYDSFTYNLVHLVEKILNEKVEVFRNNEIALEEAKKYDKIILSPGPGIPSEAGLLLPLIKEYASTKPILGVCLGHQAIGEAFGGTLTNLSTVFHGVATKIQIGNRKSEVEKNNNSQFSIHHSRLGLFNNLPCEIEVGRYHSWVVDKNNFPDELEITAEDDNGFIMALQHKTFDVQGVQFHPESVLTPNGETIMRNWLKK
ncbi:MAG: aminodeoxychorismate/anthranilate synthase component II [Bacteroidetes bacterium]|nr:aminodeoxychorismate/anthranilate synthase component II [Bacteroidota bacterium]MBS1643056.1 aminodeoxychorismate/anthranilate synthase component II [Bacteroidota bacterium]MBS1671009.1 aminodeoxychorismate/anthranilate synthase component II [Bacteroidota bacterium]